VFLNTKYYLIYCFPCKIYPIKAIYARIIVTSAQFSFCQGAANDGGKLSSQSGDGPADDVVQPSVNASHNINTLEAGLQPTGGAHKHPPFPAPQPASQSSVHTSSTDNGSTPQPRVTDTAVPKNQQPSSSSSSQASAGKIVIR